MKRIFLLTAAMLVWGNSLVAAELKIMVPVDEFKQMKSRLEALETENSQLKQNAAAGPVAATSEISEMQRRLQVVENENSRLRQELNIAKSQDRAAAADAEIQARLETVERENRLLKEEAQSRQSDKGLGGEDAALAAKLNSAENENVKLQQEIKNLKDGGLMAIFGENKISARELYFLKRKKGVSHIYKF